MRRPTSGSAPDASATVGLVRAFLDRTLPKSQWTHESHLRVGLWHVLTYGPQEALTRLRREIRAYNEATGVANTDTGGYHETITRFYVGFLARFLEQAGRERPIDELAYELIQKHGERDLPLAWYSRELLFSAKARVEWVEPDLRPLAESLRALRAGVNPTWGEWLPG
jgi:hypothetical protein